MPRKPRAKMSAEELAKAREYDAEYKRKQRAKADHVEKRSKDTRMGRKRDNAEYMREYRKRKKI